jgi:predicted dehydrogenase
MESTLALGVIGAGSIWKAHEKNLALIGGARVAAVCDPVAAHREAVAEAHGARAYERIADLFAGEGGLDGLIVCTPPNVRLEVIERAAERRLPVFVEKPPAMRLEDAAAAVEVVERANLPVQVGFMFRYLPVVARVRELLRGRTVIQTISWFLCPAATDWPLAPWFFVKAISGGHIIDQAIHLFDLLRYLVGDVAAVYSAGSNLVRPKSETFTVEDSSSTLIHYRSGATGLHAHSWAVKPDYDQILLIGHDFRLGFDVWQGRLRGFVDGRELEESHPMPEGEIPHTAELRAFLTFLRTREEGLLLSPYPDAARSLAMALAVNESIESGLPVRLEI